jgi:hypothetical protein
MQERDGRSIPDAALEVLRERAVAMHEAGNAQALVAQAARVRRWRATSPRPRRAMRCLARARRRPSEATTAGGAVKPLALPEVRGEAAAHRRLPRRDTAG